MTHQYDAIGELYERTKHLPVGLAERGTLLAAMPDLAGRSVLDVGSGTGFYPRLYKQLGAARVTGVDAAPEMVTHARQVEERAPSASPTRCTTRPTCPSSASSTW